MSALLVFNEGKTLGERRIKIALHFYLFTLFPHTSFSLSLFLIYLLMSLSPFSPMFRNYWME
ncbi:uncharacterized protein BDW43DRAFT_261405 [Aspergillus alliaceus]|uniref:uncharacterized protein n=1 Tax=Petromyces alliaceus TaxID=209559 RepID=UPI0012A5FEF9|nr:uncharacterized protein BDW43DRAFT_261405 [Aspergillus alliaceus]KAB8238343.1 hypothetical protein BDW43DRAFT_261405 [Aspergillus alliaceus]